MEIIGIEGAEQCLEQCPLECHSENEMYFTESNKVVRIWDMVTTASKAYRIRMAELNIVEDGTVIHKEAFFDTAAVRKKFRRSFRSF